MNINKLILPDNTEVDVKLKPFSKDFSLVENGWMTAGKLAASTVGLGIVGAGAGAGLAFIPHPQKLQSEQQLLVYLLELSSGL